MTQVAAYRAELQDYYLRSAPYNKVFNKRTPLHIHSVTRIQQSLYIPSCKCNNDNYNPDTQQTSKQMPNNAQDKKKQRITTQL